MAPSLHDVHDNFSFYLTHIVRQMYGGNTVLEIIWGAGWKSETQPNASDLKKELSKGFAQKDFFENQRTPVEIMLLLNSKIQTIIHLLSRLLPSMIQILLLNQENAKLETYSIPVNLFQGIGMKKSIIFHVSKF